MFCPSVCLRIFLPLYIRFYLSLFICQSFYLSLYLFLSQSICLPFYLSIYLSVSQSVCLFLPFSISSAISVFPSFYIFLFTCVGVSVGRVLHTSSFLSCATLTRSLTCLTEALAPRAIHSCHTFIINSLRTSSTSLDKIFHLYFTNIYIIAIQLQSSALHHFPPSLHLSLCFDASADRVFSQLIAAPLLSAAVLITEAERQAVCWITTAHTDYLGFVAALLRAAWSGLLCFAMPCCSRGC